MLRWVMVLTAATVFSTTTLAEDWYQFRGGKAGKLSDLKHPMSWSKVDNVAWTTPMKGVGWSSPITVGDRIFLTSAESEKPTKPKGMMAGVASMATYRKRSPVNHRFVVSCFDLQTGQPLWARTVQEAIPPTVHPSNTYATESPATDGQRVFVFFATTGTLTAWDVDGNELWRQELGAFKTGNAFGTGSSLAVFGGHVFVQHDNEENSYVASFDAETGQSVWRNKRSTSTSWSTPLIWQHGNHTELVTCGADVVTSYDPEDGQVFWRLSGMQSAFSGSPALDSKRIYFGNSGPMSAGPLVAVPAGLRGEIRLDGDFEAEQIAWSRTKSGPGLASPVVAAGRLYIPKSGGILNCYDTKTGERIYRKRVGGMGTVAASLWADDERVLILDERGVTHVIGTGSEFEILGKNKIEDLFWSTPAIVGDTLLLRGVDNLYCIRRPQSSARKSGVSAGARQL